MRLLTIAMLATLLGTSACASAGPTGGSRSRNAITAEEIADFAESVSVYDAIQRLRPHWLQPFRSVGTGERATAQAWMDGRYLGELEELRREPIRFVTEIRYLPGTETAARYGADAGIIMVSTRAGSD